jgi:hypothetical protein
MNLTKTYGYGNSQNTQVLTAGAASTATGTAVTSLKVRIATTAAVYLNFGISTVTATSSNMILPANAVEYFTIDLAQGFTYVAVLEVTAAGQVSITEVH